MRCLATYTFCKNTLQCFKQLGHIFASSSLPPSHSPPTATPTPAALHSHLRHVQHSLSHIGGSPLSHTALDSAFAPTPTLAAPALTSLPCRAQLWPHRGQPLQPLAPGPRNCSGQGQKACVDRKTQTCLANTPRQLDPRFPGGVGGSLKQKSRILFRQQYGKSTAQSLAASRYSVRHQKVKRSPRGGRRNTRNIDWASAVYTLWKLKGYGVRGKHRGSGSVFFSV